MDETRMKTGRMVFLGRLKYQTQNSNSFETLPDAKSKNVKRNLKK